VRIHCHCLTTDANKRVRIERLVEFMRHSIADYAIPKSKLAAARHRDAKYNSSSAVTALHYEARNTFTDVRNTGEGGELLLFLLAERFLKLPMVLCKMDLKTSDRMHYHGADGVYAGITSDGVLKLYWGESKIHGNATQAVRECIASLSPFLLQQDSEQASRERDLILLSDKADLNDPQLTAAFKKYFDRSSPLSNRVEYCGIALVGFDVDFYPDGDAEIVADDILIKAKDNIVDWQSNIGKHLVSARLQNIDIHFLCLPMPSVEKFREHFLTSLGMAK
jgi:hypothetical protein